MLSNYLILCHTLLLCIQSFPASRSFPESQLLPSRGQSIGAWASASILPVNIQDWFPLALTDLISLLSKELLRLLQHHSLKTSILQHSAFFRVQLSQPYVTTMEKPQLWLYRPLLAKWCLCFLILCPGFHSFPSKGQTSFNFMATVTAHSDFGA